MARIFARWRRRSSPSVRWGSPRRSWLPGCWVWPPADLAALRAATGSELQAGEQERLERLGRMRDRRYQILRWTIRSEREEAQVNEEYRLTGSLADRPVDEKGMSQLRLVPRGDKY